MLEAAVQITAEHGTEGLTIRSLAKALSIPPSLVCYYFTNKDSLTAAMASYAIDILRIERSKLPVSGSTAAQLQSRIAFQFRFSRYVLAVLKYYMGNREHFKKNKTGYLPDTAYKHIQELFSSNTVASQQKAKTLTHAINGYVLEYFPKQMNQKEIKQLSQQLLHFIE